MDKEAEIETLKHKLKEYEDRYGIVEKRGLSNWRNLFRKPSLEDWLILFMLLMMFVVAWAYQHDTAECRETLRNIDTICMQLTKPQTFPNLTVPNLTSYGRKNLP